MKRLINCRVIGYQGLQEIEIDLDKKIQSIKPQESAQGIDIEGDWVSLGGVDIQINGALGLAFPDVETQDIEKVKEIGYFLWEQGIDSYLPTIVTTSVEKIQTALSILGEVMEWQKNTSFSGAQILGIHLEGPFLNPEKRGAHPEEYLLSLSKEALKWIIGDYVDLVKVITLAPELDTREEVIPYLRSLGIIVSLGHSQATAEQAKVAFRQGATMVTHAYNAMPPLHHRRPGLLGEAMVNPEVYCGLIADGEHVSPTMIDILLRVSNYDQGVFLVSDALSPIGLSEGIYPWDDREIEIKRGTARLKDGTLAGTTVPLLATVENLLHWGICDVETAISLATGSPRKALGLHTLGEGQLLTSLLRWHNKQGKLTWQRISDTLE